MSTLYERLADVARHIPHKRDRRSGEIALRTISRYLEGATDDTAKHVRSLVTIAIGDLGFLTQGALEAMCAAIVALLEAPGLRATIEEHRQRTTEPGEEPETIATDGSGDPDRGVTLDEHLEDRAAERGSPS
jgi:hypothetical protein